LQKLPAPKPAALVVATDSVVTARVQETQSAFHPP